MRTLPSRGRKHPAQQMQKGALAAAARADDGDEVALGDFQRDVGQRGDRLAAMLELFADGLEGNHAQISCNAALGSRRAARRAGR